MENPVVFFILAGGICLILLSVVIALAASGNTKLVQAESDRIIENAIAHGYITKATLVSSTYCAGTPGTNSYRYRSDRWLAVYAYQINGKTYKFRGYSYSEPAATLDFYFDPSRPNKAVPKGITRLGWKLDIASTIPLIILVILYWIVTSLVK